MVAPSWEELYPGFCAISVVLLSASSLTMFAGLIIVLWATQTLATAVAGPITAAGSIREKFAARRKYFGNIADGSTLGNSKTQNILTTHFDAITAENRHGTISPII
jgi:hypothetical protein